MIVWRLPVVLNVLAPYPVLADLDFRILPCAVCLCLWGFTEGVLWVVCLSSECPASPRTCPLTYRSVPLPRGQCRWSGYLTGASGVPPAAAPACVALGSGILWR